jgi:hypothetical protein
LGSLPLSAYGIEAADAHPDREPVDGLFAVSVTRITTFTDSIAEAHPPYRSLAGREPLARIGKGILVYRLQGELVAVQLT